MIESLNDLLGKKEECKGEQKKMKSRFDENMTPYDSLKMQIVADCKEGGGVEKQPQHLVNQHSVDNDLLIRSPN